MNVKSIAKAYNSVKKFNKISEKLFRTDAENIDNQLSYIFEELTEGIDAFEAGDCVELLDAGCDMLVVVFGLLQMLEANGYNVEEAIERVCANNLSKFVPVGSPLKYAKGITKTLNEEYQVYVLKDENMKVRKPSNFVSVVLDDLVPQDFFKE